MKFIITILLSLVCLSPLFSQNSTKLKDLESKRKTIIQQIAGINKKLKANQKISMQSMEKLQLIETQIVSRKKLIDVLSSEIMELDKQMLILQAEIAALEKELNQKKGEYGKAVQLVYMKRSSYDKIMFILSSNSLAQGYRRARYLKEYATWSRLKGQEIMRKQDELNAKRDELQKNKQEKGSLLAMRQQETKNLQVEESKQKVVVDDLNKEQQKLKTTLAKQKRQAAALDRQIQRIIQEEVRRAQEEARRAAAREEEARRQRQAAEEARKLRLAQEEARRKAYAAESARIAAAEKLAETQKAKQALKAEKIALEKKRKQEEQKRKEEAARKASEEAAPARERVAETAGGYAMTREEKALSSDFSQNRGSLPVPVTGRYAVVGHFGQQQHENLVYVVTNNNGVDIRTDAGADARCVFKGVVTKVFAVPGYNSSVIIRHGNYLSVYSNLSRVYVKAGDHVGTRQSIGKIYSDAEDGNQAILHFQIWKETTKQNPEAWVNF